MFLYVTFKFLHIYTKSHFYYRIWKDYTFDCIVLLIEKKKISGLFSRKNVVLSQFMWLLLSDAGFFSWKESWELAHLPRRPVELHWLTGIEASLGWIAPAWWDKSHCLINIRWVEKAQKANSGGKELSSKINKALSGTREAKQWENVWFNSTDLQRHPQYCLFCP